MTETPKLPILWYSVFVHLARVFGVIVYTGNAQDLSPVVVPLIRPFRRY